MRRRDFFGFLLLAWIVLLAIATLQSSPGYMDADYYYAIGARLATGHGFTEPFLWNFLDDPVGLPHPSNSYWMPLASLLSAIGMKLSGAVSFTAARSTHLFLASIIPPLTALLAFSSTKNRYVALIAGFLAVFPGFYLPFLTTTDTFGVGMLLGTLWFLSLEHQNSDVSRSSNLANKLRTMLNRGQPLLLGLLAGFMYLARVDSILWFFLGILVVTHGKYNRSRAWVIGFPLILYLMGYFLIVLPWFMRNLIAFGTSLTPSGGKVLWLTGYDELYLYPSSLLTFTRWWGSGLWDILQSRLWAFGQNLQTIFAVQGEVYLLPLILIGGWRLRREAPVKFVLLIFGLEFLVMTLVFPFAGARGGLFHSGAIVQPLLWILAAVGLDDFIDWGIHRRGWDGSRARRVFGIVVVGLSVLLTFLVSYQRVIGKDLRQPAWGQSQDTYMRLEAFLAVIGANPEEIVMVNNPPGYFVASGRSAVAIPEGDVETSLLVAQQFGVDYLLLEENHPRGMDNLYTRPRDYPGLRYIQTIDRTHLFRIGDG